jgi:hypothetical protein
MAQKTAISFLNTQVQTLSTTVSNQGAGAVTAAQFSSLSSFVSTLAYLDFTNLSTYTSSLTAQVYTNSTNIGSFNDFSTAQTSINTRLDGLSTYVSSLQLETVSTGVQALQTFSTAQTSANTRYDGVSTTLSTAVSTNTAQTAAISTLQAFSTFQVSTFNQTMFGVSTTLSTVVSTNTAQNTSITALQSFSSAQAVQNVIYNSASTSGGIVFASTPLFNYGQRRGQAYYGPWVEFGSGSQSFPKWGNPDGTSAGGTSTIMIGDIMRGVTLINNQSTQDVTLPLYMGIAANGYAGTVNMVPSTFSDIMRFAHVGIPGSNSSITINLVSSGSATAAITLSAGEVVTMLYKGGTGSLGGASSTSNYYYIPSL